MWHELAVAAVLVGRLERQKHDPWTAAMASAVLHSSAHLIQIQTRPTTTDAMSRKSQNPYITSSGAHLSSDIASDQECEAAPKSEAA